MITVNGGWGGYNMVGGRLLKGAGRTGSSHAEGGGGSQHVLG